VHLILFSGLPGTGKSTVAEIVGQRLGIPVFSKDWLEATLLGAGITAAKETSDAIQYAAYELLLTLARRQLAIQQSCSIDCVASQQSLRQQFQTLATDYHADWRVIECTCSDEGLHRIRLTNRQRSIPGYRELTWQQLLETKTRFVPWTHERLILDTVQPLMTNVTAALNYIAGH
jgi:predicted kinase